MVHTATLTYILNGKEAQLYEQFKNIPGSYYAQQNYKWCNSTLKEYGITLWAYKLEDIDFCTLVMRINFIRLVEQQDRIVVMTENDIPRIETKFNELMDNLMPGLPHFHAWKVNRIDYCINVHTEYADTYIKLLQDSDIPATMKQQTDRHGNYTFKPGSFYLLSKARNRSKKKTGSKTINFYDKFQELQEQLRNEEPGVTAEVVEQGRNILRLEVQCFKPLVEYLKVKGGFPAKYIHYYLNAEIGYNIIERAIKLSCGTADFQRRLVAHEMIDSLSCHQKTKDCLKKMINDISRSSLHKTKKKYLENNIMSESQFRYYLQILNKNNINPVTISKNEKLPGKTTREGLKSLWELFYEAYTAELTFDTDTYDIFDVDSFVNELLLEV